jgi:large subunit ribosomal protein L15
MQLNQLKPIHKQKKKTRVGRGGKKGTYSGKGNKGQTSRAGHRYKPITKELIKRYPKLRGHRTRFRTQKVRPDDVVLNLDILEKKFNAGEEVSPKNLLEKRIINKEKGMVPKIKILAKGNLTKSLVFKNCQFSKAAKEKVEKAGGKINL